MHSGLEFSKFHNVFSIVIFQMFEIQIMHKVIFRANQQLKIDDFVTQKISTKLWKWEMYPFGLFQKNLPTYLWRIWTFELSRIWIFIILDHCAESGAAIHLFFQAACQLLFSACVRMSRRHSRTLITKPWMAERFPVAGLFAKMVGLLVLIHFAKYLINV